MTKLKPVHWAAAVGISAGVHLAMFVSGNSAQMPSSERSAGSPAAVWGVAANSLMQEVEPVEDQQVEPEKMEDVTEPEEKVAEVEPEVLPQALSEVAPSIIPEAEIKDERPLEAIEPVKKVVKKPRPKPKKKTASIGGAVGQAAGNQGRTSSSTSGASTANFSSRILSHLQRYKRHPGGWAKGTVRMVFVLGSNGSVRSVKITGRSGNSALDNAALAMVRRAAPFPSFPSGIGKPSLTFSVPVRFSP